MKKFEPLAISSSCTAWFVSDLVRIHIVGFPTLHLNYISGFGFGMIYLPSIVSVGYYFERKRGSRHRNRRLRVWYRHVHIRAFDKISPRRTGLEECPVCISRYNLQRVCLRYAYAAP